MALLSKHDFCNLIGITYNNLVTYFNRHKFVYSGDFIDTDLPINRVFIDERHVKMGIAPKPLPVHNPIKEPKPKKQPKEKKVKEKPTPPPIIPPKATIPPVFPAFSVNKPKVEMQLALTAKNEAKSVDNSKIFDIVARKKEADLAKTTLGNDILEVKKEQLLKKIVPTADVQPIIFRLMKAWLDSAKIADKDVLKQIAHKYSMSTEDMAYFRGLFVKKRNYAIDRAVELAIADFDTVTEIHSEKRGKGERI